MEYRVYTDGSCLQQRGLSSYAYFIRTRRTIVAADAYAFNGDDSVIAEILAVGAAVERLLKERVLFEKDEVTILTDCEAAWNFCQTMLGLSHKRYPYFKDARIKQVRCQLRRLTEICPMKVRLARAHLSDMNGNGVVDRLARAAIQQALCKKSVERRG